MMLRRFALVIVLTAAGWATPQLPAAAAATNVSVSTVISQPATARTMNDALQPSIRASTATTSTLFLPVVLKQVPVGHWVTIFQDNFEGSFPGTHWTLVDTQPGSGDYLWALNTCHAHSGSHSVWGIGGGTEGSQLSCGVNYPNNIITYMVYGPFDLSNATAADFSFGLWIDTELHIDGVGTYGSADGNNFDGLIWSGSSAGTFAPAGLDLSQSGTQGNLVGHSQVWLALTFESNASTVFPNGAFVDDFLLRKCVGGPCAAVSAINSRAAGVLAAPAHRSLVRP